MRGLVPWLYPWGRALLSFAASQGWSYSVDSVRRSARTQARLYRDYLAGRSRYPALPPGQSLHQVGRAFDLAASPQVLKALGRKWQSWGGRWGGKSDPIHFEA